MPAAHRLGASDPDDPPGLRPHVTSTRPRLAYPTLAVCAAAGLALVIAVGLQAPAASEGLRWQPTKQPAPPLEFPPMALTWSLPLDGEAQTNRWPAWLTWTLVGVVFLAVVVVIARVVRRLLGLLRRRETWVTVVGTAADAPAPGEADANVVVSGLASALQVLNSERISSDAVVQAWQGLENAAAAAGLTRRPAETASEFTVRLLKRSRSLAEPVTLLLSLYQRVRFGHHAPTDTDIVAARSALGTLLELWRADLPERRGARVHH